MPRAALHLKLAQEQTEKARRLMQDGYNERAELTLKRAQADAELAIAIAKEHETVQRAQQAQAKLDQLKAAAEGGRHSETDEECDDDPRPASRSLLLGVRARARGLRQRAAAAAAARRARRVQPARIGKAAQYTPADLHTAKVALNAAEKAYEDDAESPETFALSYVALRTAQLVESKANTKAAEADLAARRRRVPEAARAARSPVRAASWRLLARTSRPTSQQLDAERKAREQDEQRYQEAMRKLAEAAALNVKEEPRGTVIVLPGEVLFATGKAELTAVAQQKLTLIAGTLAPQAEEHDIVVEGHTDSRGSRDFNMQLSLSRAQSVMNFLVSRGVAGRVDHLGGHRAGPSDRRQQLARRPQQNRRVEIIIKPREKR